jgi:preprotein translocase subunit SecD
MGNAHVESASVSIDEMSGSPRVDLVFTADGGQRFAELTRGLVQRRLAIVLDGRVLSAPVVMEEIDGGRAMVTMGGGGSAGTQLAEARALAVALDVGEPLACDWTLESIDRAAP